MYCIHLGNPSLGLKYFLKLPLAPQPAPGDSHQSCLTPHVGHVQEAAFSYMCQHTQYLPYLQRAVRPWGMFWSGQYCLFLWVKYFPRWTFSSLASTLSEFNAFLFPACRSVWAIAHWREPPQRFFSLGCTTPDSRSHSLLFLFLLFTTQ